MDINTQLGKYKLTEKLGSGGMAHVFKAFQSGVERHVAVKVMHAHLADDPDFQDRFRREARSVGQLTHPHIVRVIEFENDGDNAYMVMEYMPGGTLRDLLFEMNGAMLPKEAVAIVKQLADALRYAHRRGMIHRDIKPDNVMFTDERHEHAVLTDFGIARMRDQTMLTMSGTLLGTPEYMAPETIKGDEVDGRADLYSLGAMLYEMVTGQAPFSAGTPYAVMMKHVSATVPRPREVNRSISAELERLILRALEKDPNRRFQSADEMLVALQRLEQKTPVEFGTIVDAAPVVEKPTPPKQVKPRQPTAQPVTPTLGPATPTRGSVTPTLGPEMALDLDDEDGQPLPPPRPVWPLILGVVAAVALLGAALFFTVSRTSDPLTADEATVEVLATEVIAAAPTDPPPPTDAPTEPPTIAPTEPPAAVPTEVPTEAPTIAPTPAVAVIDFDNAPLAFVCNIDLRNSDGGQADLLVLSLDRVRAPAADAQYVAWLLVDETPTLLGVVPVENGRVAFEALLTIDAFSAHRFAITVEPLDSTLDTPTGVPIVVGSIAEAALEPLRGLLSADLPNLTAQLLIAIDHRNLMQESLDAGDLDGALRHAEHTLNVLNGIDGANFGDLDGNGQAENPGDDVGVRVYLAQAQANHDVLTGAISPFSEVAYAAAGAQLADAVAALDSAEATLLKLFAVDSAEEAAPFSVTANDLLQSGLTQIGQATDSAQTLFARTLLAGDETLDVGGDAAGAVVLLADGTQLMVVAPDGLTAAPEGFANELWVQRRGESLVNLGVLDAHGELTVEIEGDGLADLVSAEIWQSPADTEPDTPTGEPLFVGTLDPQIRAAADVWLFGDAPLIPNLIAQAELAEQHSLLMQEALAAGSLAEAQQHAEHAVNILEGVDGSNFGDLDGNGRAENPGDDIGVRRYLVDARAAIPDLEDEAQQFYAALLARTLDNQLAQLEVVVEQALTLLAADSAESAQPFAQAQVAAATALLDGADLDQNGVVDLISAEGGIRTLRSLITNLAHLPLE